MNRSTIDIDSLTIEEARVLYNKLHKLFGIIPDPIAPITIDKWRENGHSYPHQPCDIPLPMPMYVGDQNQPLDVGIYDIKYKN